MILFTKIKMALHVKNIELTYSESQDVKYNNTIIRHYYEPN